MLVAATTAAPQSWPTAFFNNTVYLIKGSGSNGINTGYQVGTAGILPATASIPAPITILPGFPAKLAKAAATRVPIPSAKTVTDLENNFIQHK